MLSPLDHSWLRVILLWTWLALSVTALTQDHALHVNSVSTDSSVTTVEFSLQCRECQQPGREVGDYDALYFLFEAGAHEQTCTDHAASSVFLNGQRLEHPWDLTLPEGEAPRILSAAVTSTGRDAPHLCQIEYFTSCLYDEDSSDPSGLPSLKPAAHLLHVRLVSVDQHDVPSDTGFRIAYRQNPTPEHLRLESGAWDRLEDYTFSLLPQPIGPPSRSSPFAEAVDSTDSALSVPAEQPSLDDELGQLRDLWAQAHELHSRIKQKETLIQDRFGNASIQSLSPANCRNVKCRFTTAVRKLWNHLPLVTSKVQNTMMLSSTHRNESRAEKWEYTPLLPSVAEEDEDQIKAHGLLVDVKQASAASEEDRRAFSTIIRVLVVVLGCGCIGVASRQCCRGSRTGQHEPTCTHEDRRSDRYLQRPGKPSFRQRWFRPRWSKRSSNGKDYEEKRAMILAQEGILEDAMQRHITALRHEHQQHQEQAVHDEIRQLRHAHDMLGRLITAGSSRSPTHHYRSSGRTRSISSTSSNGRPASRSSSLPDYTSEAGSSGRPPAYEELEENDSGTAANGFGARYSPCQSTDDEEAAARADWTPDSSVIDVSPRPSFETLNVIYARGELDNGLSSLPPSRSQSRSHSRSQSRAQSRTQSRNRGDRF